MKTRQELFNDITMAHYETDTIPDELDRQMAKASLEWGFHMLTTGDLKLAEKIINCVKQKILNVIK